MLVMPDRFRNGDPRNDRAGDASCFDPADPRKFHGGDLAGLRQHLDYIQEVGATAVWITPPDRQVGCGYHGYWIDDGDPATGELEPKLGSDADLDGLVADLHARGMRFVLDRVVNHAGTGARIAAQHPAWFHDRATCKSLGPPHIFCPLGTKPDFAQERPEVARYLTQREARMIERHHVDGIRMDTAKHVPASYFRDSFFPALKPHVFAVAEIWDGVASYRPYLDAGFASAFHFPLYYALDAAIAHGGSVDAVADAIGEGIAKLGADRALDLVLMIDNHDTPRFASQPGRAVPAAEINRRMQLALVLLFTLPGIPQLYSGDELALYGGADPDNRRDFPAWAMDPAERAEPHADEAAGVPASVFARVQRLAQLRRTVLALADGAYRELLRQGGAGRPNVLAFSRGHGQAMRIVAINNEAASVSVPIPVALAEGTQLVDELGDGAPPVTITGGALALALGAKSAAIYRVR